MENKDKILEKLRKLMNLEESARSLGNEGEANAAAAGISRLLMEYNLSLDDIPDKEKLENPVVSEEIPYKAESFDGPWYRELVRVVCNYNFCKSLIVSKFRPETGCRRKENFEIIGRNRNVEVVLYLISCLSHQFVSIGRERYLEYKYRCIRHWGVTPATPAKYIKSFLFGCVNGLEQKLQESSELTDKKEKITALSVSTAAEIEDFLKEEKIAKSKRITLTVNVQALADGYETGHSVEIRKGVHQDTVPDTCLLL